MPANGICTLQDSHLADSLYARFLYELSTWRLLTYTSVFCHLQNVFVSYDDAYNHCAGAFLCHMLCHMCLLVVHAPQLTCRLSYGGTASVGGTPVYAHQHDCHPHVQIWLDHTSFYQLDLL